MNWLEWVFLESPLALGAFAFVLGFALLVYWRRSGRALPLLVGLGLLLLLFVVQAAVETRREIATRLLTPVEEQAVAGNVDQLQAILAPGFLAGVMQAEEFLDLAKQRLDAHPLVSVQRLRSEIESSQAERFWVRNGYYVTGRFGSLGGGAFQCSVLFEFVRAADGWRLASIAPPKVQGMQFQSWGDVVAP